MSATALAHRFGSWSSPAHHARHPVSWQDVARVARRRATALDTEIPTTVLVGQVLDRFNDAFGHGARPVDLDGWVRRTLRELVTVHERERENASSGLAADNAVLAALLTSLTVPVRSPALAKRRKSLLRRVAEVIGGQEGSVVLTMADPGSGDQLVVQLYRYGVDVIHVQNEGLTRLRHYLDHHPDFRQQLIDAGRQPHQARTAPLPDAE